MAIPYFLDKPESNKGIIRQVIFPKFRGINEFLYLRQGDEMKYKEVAQSQNDKVVKFGYEKTLKSANVEEQVKNGDLTETTEIFHDLIVECLATIGLSEYVAAEIPEFKEKLKIDWSKFIMSNQDKFCVEKLMQKIFDNYVSVITQTAIAPSLVFFSPNFINDYPPLKLRNPPKIDADAEKSEHYKYINLLLPGELLPDEDIISKGFLLEEDRLPLAISYCFYYALKDILSSCYLQITLPQAVPVPLQELGLNILEEITLDLKNLPANILDITKLPKVIEDLENAVAEQTILAQANISLVAPDPDTFKTTRALKSSEIELKDKLKNIHNYDNNPDNIPVIQLEEMNNDV